MASGPKGWAMDFTNSMSGGAETPFRPGGGKRAEKEAAKMEARARATKALSKLHDRDTVNNGISEIVALSEEIKPENGVIIINLLAEFEDTKNAFARSHAARLFPAVALANFAAFQGGIGKMVIALCKRLKDPDHAVRDSVAEAVGELARIVLLQEPALQAGAKKEDDAESELDLSQLSVSDEGGDRLGLFFGKVLLGIEGGDNQLQQGSALALAHVIFNAGARVEPHVEKLAKRMVTALDRQQFAGRSQLLIAVANLIEVCPDAVVGLLKIFLPRIYSAAASSDFQTRKAAMETLETVCARLSPDMVALQHGDMLEVAKKCKYDKMKPVREAAALTLAALKRVSPVGQEGDDQEEEDAAEQEEPSVHMEPETPKAPAQSLKVSTVSRAQVPDSVRRGMAASASGGCNYAPSKEHWDTLLKHFDVITRQQDHLINMVASFSEATRDRLETVEQKVFALELRLQQQDNRQSLPHMPPTPSRAIGSTPSKAFGATPGKGTPARVPLAHVAEQGNDVKIAIGFDH